MVTEESGSEGGEPDATVPDEAGLEAGSETDSGTGSEAATDDGGPDGAVYVEAGPGGGVDSGPDASSVDAGVDAAIDAMSGGGTLFPLPPWGWTASSNPPVTGADAPASAIDGSLATRFSTDTPMQPGFYYQLGFGSAQTFSQITLDLNGQTNDSAVSYSVTVSNDGTNWGNPIAMGTGGSAFQTIMFPQQTAQYVRVTQTGTSASWWSIDEINVWAVRPLVQTPISGTHTPLSRAAWVASAFPVAGDAPINAIDNNPATRYSPDQNQTPWQYLQVKLGSAPQSFTQATIDAAGFNADYPTAFAIFVSNDGMSWGSPIATGTGSTQLITVQFPTQNAQYVRFCTAGESSINWWSLAEFNLLQ
jgi:beta-glucosidase